MVYLTSRVYHETNPRPLLELPIVSYYPSPYLSRRLLLVPTLAINFSLSKLAPCIIMVLTDRSDAIIAINSIFPSLAVFAVALRFYARKLKASAFMADDYMIIFSLVRAASYYD